MSSPESREDWILRQARAWPPAERAAFLHGACAGDLALRQRIEAVLAEQMETGDFPAATLPDPNVPGSPAEALTEEGPGAIIGRYRLLEKVGEGGFGSVYAAEQKEPVKRRVALKIIKLGMDTRQVVARFEAERQALALMDHPNIAKVLDAGATDSGRPYFVMELVHGIPITQYCDQNNLPTEKRLRLFIQVCQAIQHAHQKGVIHRDIKPSNILVTVQDPDRSAVPKVIDFGIAKATQQQLTDKTVYTQLEQFIGTPAYMSPEQAEMSALDVDTRSDIYSLGVLLYELLVGRTPFDTRELLQSGVESMRRMIREKEAVRPSTRLDNLPEEERTTTAKRRAVEAPKLVSLLRGDLDWIVMRCLEKDRTLRYETANGLAMDVERFMRSEPVVARPHSTGYRVRKFVRRNRVMVTAAAMVGVALVLGVAGSTWQAIRATRLRQEARRELAQLHVMSGVQLMNAADYFKSLLWFSEALDIDKGSPARAEIHQMRLAAVLAQCPRLVQVISHDGLPIAGATFSPIDDRLATIGADRTVRVWEIPSGKLLMKSKPLSALPFAISFSPDGARLLVVMVDKTARLLDPETGTQLLEPLPHLAGGAGDSIFLPVFDPSGKRLLTQPREEELQLWDVETGKPLGRRMVHTNQLAVAQFSADGTRLFTRASTNFSACNFAWDANSGDPFAFPFSGPETIEDFHFCQKANLALVDGRIYKWGNTASKVRVPPSAGFALGSQAVPIGEPVVGPYSLMGADFSPTGDRLLTASSDRTARIWDTATGKPLGPPLPHDQWVNGVKFSPDGRRVLTVSADNQARVWETDTGQPLTPPISQTGAPDVSAFSGSGRYLVTMHSSFLACVWDLQHQDSPPVLLRPLGVGDAEVGSRGGVFVSKSVNNLIRVQSTASSLNVALQPASLKSTPLQMWFDATTRFVIVEGEMATVQILEAASGVPITPSVRSRYGLDEKEFKNVKLPLAGLPVADATELAQLLSGSRLDGTGGWIPLKSEELVSAWQRLSEKYPGLFTNAEVDSASWHRREAEAAQAGGDWSSAAFHWERLQAAQPDNREVAERHEYALKCLAKAAEAAQDYSTRRRVIPPRDPQAGAGQVDLTDYYNAPLEGVRLGVQTLAGVQFDVRGVVTLPGKAAQLRGDHGPSQVAGLRVQRRCKKLHLLHTASWAHSVEGGGEDVADLVIRYANGKAEKITIRDLVQIANDWSSYGPPSLKEAQVAWIGTDPGANSFQNCICLYKYTWPNPHPDWEISQVDLFSAQGEASYSLVAMTVE